MTRNFNSNAAAYERAAEIQSWYKNGSLDAVEWFILESAATVYDGNVDYRAVFVLGHRSVRVSHHREGGLIVDVGWCNEDAYHNEQQHALGVAKPGSPSELSTATPAYKPEHSPVELNTQRAHAELLGRAPYINPPHNPKAPVELDASTTRY